MKMIQFYKTHWSVKWPITKKTQLTETGKTEKLF